MRQAGAAVYTPENYDLSANLDETVDIVEKVAIVARAAAG